jgi:hypothetical protein
MTNWLLEWWHHRQRRIDLDILWPSIRNNAASLDKAKQAFRMHAYCDRAWNGISRSEIDKILEERRS